LMNKVTSSFDFAQRDRGRPTRGGQTGTCPSGALNPS
jgi:hypothetical protein